ncbi:MAG: ThuA domain-containing protein [Verrucomicrobiota bacterium]
MHKQKPISQAFRLFFFTLVACGLSAGLLPSSATAQDAAKLKVVLIDGQNNHDWARTSRELLAGLERIGGFEVHVETSPKKEEWDNWTIDFSKYDVVLNNYYGDPWPKGISEGLLAFLKNGGGMVNVHAANNAFPNWPEFNEITGLLWRNPIAGDRIHIDDATGKAIRVKRGEGIGAGHGRKHPFVIKIRDGEHPIMKGLPTEWLHAFDELYHGQRGPAKNMQILSSAYSSKESGGSGMHEPMTWTIPYGEGRVVTTVLGHLWKGQKELDGLQCVGFQTVVARSLQWAAHEKVTLPVPDNFPTKDKVSLAVSPKEESEKNS